MENWKIADLANLKCRQEPIQQLSDLTVLLATMYLLRWYERLKMGDIARIFFFFYIQLGQQLR